MESYQIKSELQDILDSDIQLRKEYSELKRSLSDYRNQLISRDEDCKRLQVTIDILNTKLVVMERDNTSYKSEITAFNELREGINAQLESKQSELDAMQSKLSVIQQQFENERNILAIELQEFKARSEQDRSNLEDSWQLRFNQLSTQAKIELDAVKSEFVQNFENREFELNRQLQELKNQLENQKQEADQFYNEQIRIQSEDAAIKWSSLIEQHEQALLNLKSDLTNNFEQERNALVRQYEDQLAQTVIQANAQNDKWSQVFHQNEQVNQSLLLKMNQILSGWNLSDLQCPENSFEAAAHFLLDAMNRAYISRSTELEQQVQGFQNNQIEFNQSLQDAQHAWQSEVSLQKSANDELMMDNANLNSELDRIQIECAQLKEQIHLLNLELNEERALSRGKAQDIQELISEKNFEFIALHAEMAALREELSITKRNTQERLNETDNTQTKWESDLRNLEASNNQLHLENVKLLNEKDQLANQLIRMNEILSGLSQNVDSQNINVDALQAHRKNVILAESNGIKEKSPMKEQINELVREIDKCIALLGA